MKIAIIFLFTLALLLAQSNKLPVNGSRAQRVFIHAMSIEFIAANTNNSNLSSEDRTIIKSKCAAILEEIK
jgi:hypothetical protein